MPASLTQFHALPEEVLAVIGPFIQQENLHVTAIRFPPFSAHAVDTSTLEHVFMDPSVGRLALTLEAPSLPATSQLSFFDQNPDALWIDIGRIVPNGLRESSISAKSSNSIALAKWRLLAKRLRGNLRAGATGVSPQTGATGWYRNHRYSAGAKALYMQGMRMLTLGTAFMRFDD
jgi:hypothetical protein